jgi:hypothetical protein
MLGDGRRLTVRRQLFNTLLMVGDDEYGWSDGWTYTSDFEALKDFMVWEPGQVTICALCQCERGGMNPPGRWISHQNGSRSIRRKPIYGGESRAVLGWLVYERE